MMKIAVLNGSPKGELSVTMQYVKCLQIMFKDVEFKIIEAASKIKKLENDDKAFSSVIAEVASAEAVIWGFPLYYLLVPSQYKRFIELIFINKNARAAFQGKPAAVLTTSINFYDHTAHNYLNAICDDLGMKYIASYSAQMHDLLRSKERRRFRKFGEAFLQAICEKRPALINNQPLVMPDVVYEPVTLTAVPAAGKKVLIIADDLSANANLRVMVETLQKTFTPSAVVVQLRDVDIKGGCLGCLQCGMDNICVYEGKDGFIDFFRQKVMDADILFFAGAIQDRYLSSLWKCFFDRSFFMGHTPALEGKQVGFVIAGPLKQIANLRQIMEAYIESQRANLIGFVSDDGGSSAEISAGLQHLALFAADFAAVDYIKPPTFLKVGGAKIFRDAIWSGLRMVFQADHKYYKKHGFYDFPQNEYKMQMVNMIVTPLTKIPFIRLEFVKRIKQEMLKPFKSALAKVK